MTGPPQLEVQSGVVKYGSVIAIDDVDFALSAGEFVVLLGANGSGKTTLVRALLGLISVSAGEVRLFGTSINRFKSWNRVGYVPQRPTASAGVPATVGEVVLSGRLARSRAFGRYTRLDHQAAQDALEIVDMGDFASTSVASLSGGQQQRVLIARALAGEPEVLVLDEPVSGIDLEHQESFAATLGGLKSSGSSVLLVAHALGVIEPLVSRAVVLTHGRISYDGPALGMVHDSHMHHHPFSIGEAARAQHPTGGAT